MKTTFWLILIGLAFVLGYCTGQRNVDPCPEVKESIDSSRKQLPPVIKVTEKLKPYKSFFAKSENVQRTCKEDSAKTDLVNPCNSFRVYSDTLKDPAGTIISQDSVRGQLLKKKITFIPNYLTVSITKEVEKPVPKSGLFIGLEAGWGQGGSRVAPEVEYQSKKGYAYSYNYDLFNNIHSLGIKKRLKF
jgi:hypothetical protein